MKQYNEIVANNPKVEMIHVSLDQNKSAAEGWAVGDQFPWYTVLPSEVQSSGFDRFKSTRYVPEYALLTANGDRIGSGNGVFEQVSKLAE